MDVTRRNVVLSAAATLALPRLALAQEYPSRAIRMVVAFSAGSGIDVAARIIAQFMSEEMKTSVVVENRDGANGTIGTVSTAKSAPDGYTLAFVSPPFTNAHFMVPDATYDPVKDFKPVARLATNPIMIVAAPSQPFKNFKELIAYAKANPGIVQYATSGKGSSSHLYTALIAQRYQLQMTDIPYRAFAMAISDIIGGRVHFFLSSYSALLPHVQKGSVNALVVGMPQRSPVLPNVSTLAEEYGDPKTDLRTWYGILAPAGTPDSVVKYLYEKLEIVMAKPALREKLEATGSSVTVMPTKEFETFIREDRDQVRKVIESLGLMQLKS
jgi:tripartite-type tricarboxylate transporter receptor subunit TctC